MRRRRPARRAGEPPVPTPRRTAPLHRRHGSGDLLLIVTPGGIEDYFRAIVTATDEPTRQVVRDQYGIHRA